MSRISLVKDGEETSAALVKFHSTKRWIDIKQRQFFFFHRLHFRCRWPLLNPPRLFGLVTPRCLLHPHRFFHCFTLFASHLCLHSPQSNRLACLLLSTPFKDDSSQGQRSTSNADSILSAYSAFLAATTTAYEMTPTPARSLVTFSRSRYHIILRSKSLATSACRI